jgi:hypothetical protein
MACTGAFSRTIYEIMSPTLSIDKSRNLSEDKKKQNLQKQTAAYQNQTPKAVLAEPIMAFSLFFSH